MLRIALFSILWLGSVTGLSAKSVVPEVYMASQQQDYCVIAVNFKLRDDEYLIDRLLRLVARSYEKTGRWERDYAIAGIDYARASFVHVVAYSGGCNNGLAIARRVMGPVCRQRRCDLVTLGKRSPLVTTDPDERYHFGIEGVDKYIGRSSLRLCSIMIKLQQALSDDQYTKVRTRFLSLIPEFRMPIIDLAMDNNEVYLVFHRDCERKEAYFAIIHRIFSPGGLSKLFERVDLDPDMSRYLFTKTGERK